MVLGFLRFLCRTPDEGICTKRSTNAKDKSAASNDVQCSCRSHTVPRVLRRRKSRSRCKVRSCCEERVDPYCWVCISWNACTKLERLRNGGIDFNDFFAGEDADGGQLLQKERICDLDISFELCLSPVVACRISLQCSACLLDRRSPHRVGLRLRVTGLEFQLERKN